MDLVANELDKQRKDTIVILPGFCTVHFTDLESVVCSYIDKAAAVTGCVAWFTNAKIMDAVARVPSRIAVQREEWLRYERLDGDAVHQSMYKRAQLERLANMSILPLCDLYQNDPLPLPQETRPEFEDRSIRCVGHIATPGSDKENRALMHHKFLVFYRHSGGCGQLEPFAVLNGSANMTKNMTNSIENMVYLEDREIAKRFHHEFLFIYGLSVPMKMEDRRGVEPVPTLVFDCSQIPRRSSYFYL